MSKKKKTLSAPAKAIVVEKPLGKALTKRTVSELAHAIGAAMLAARFGKDEEALRQLTEIRSTLSRASEGFEYQDFIPVIQDIIQRGIEARLNDKPAPAVIITETLEQYVARGGVIKVAPKSVPINHQQAKAITLESLGL
jgi:hypothetical protein